MDKCPALEKVNIHLSPSTADDTMQEFETDNSLKQEYVQRMILMGKEVCHVKSLTLFVHLSKETGEEQLLFALPMVQDFEVHLLAYIIPEMASKKCSILSSETGRTWLSGFAMIGAFALKNRAGSFLSSVAFHGFVTLVLHHHNDLKLVKLKFYCSDGDLESVTSIVFEYAMFHRVEVLETEIVGNFPPTLFECQTLKTLNLGHRQQNVLRELSSCATLTTLQLSSVIIDPENDIFSSCLSLENLLLIECRVP
ncbi:hypothetical protein EZV62_020897 [Acer yangbiense]|uniref:FBD domain-containing protein n=1 Tax=Acer yangbiense TaxID=1000413 RepID=A0A5C7HFB8_9ROSI|nr:hypothetical protein EZV62_020897 [Acer yangbiense]